MRLFPLFITLCLFPATLTASEAAAEAADSTPVWFPILTTVIALAIAWIGDMLRKKFKVDNEKAKLDANKSLMEQKNFIIDNRLIPFAVDTGQHWLSLTLPKLAADAFDGDGEFHWKDHWKDLRSYLKKRVVAKFISENIDIVQLLSDRELDNLLDRIALKLISKLPDNVKRFIPEEVVDKLTDKLSELAVDKGGELLSKHLDIDLESK